MFSQPVADNSTDFPTWNITVNDTAPIWAYVSIVNCVKFLRNLISFNSAAKRLLHPTVVLEWSCKQASSIVDLLVLIFFPSAVNSVESSARNFSAFQSVAEALNGTSAASNTDPAATSTASGTAGSNGAISVRVGGAAASLFAAALVASFL